MWISTSFEDLCDQNVIVYLLRVKAKEYMPQVGIVTLCHATSRRCQLRPDVRQDCQAFQGPSPSLTSFHAPQTLLEDGRYCMSCWFKVRWELQSNIVHYTGHLHGLQ